MNTTLATLLGFGAAALYFNESERDIPKEANCSYLAPASTDAIAWVMGAALVWRGVKHNDPLVAFTGSAIASLHMAQYGAHKVSQRRPLAELQG